jgi:hypothetical protein
MLTGYRGLGRMERQCASLEIYFLASAAQNEDDHQVVALELVERLNMNLSLDERFPCR